MYRHKRQPAKQGLTSKSRVHGFNMRSSLQICFGPAARNSNNRDVEVAAGQSCRRLRLAVPCGWVSGSGLLKEVLLQDHPGRALHPIWSYVLRAILCNLNSPLLLRSSPVLLSPLHIA